MSKKIIKLTEGDIENIVKKVIEEQNYGGPDGSLSKEEKKEIKQLRKDGTISKDDYRQLKKNPFRYSPNWGGKNSGIMNYRTSNGTPLAINVGEGRYDIRYTTISVGGGKAIQGKETPPDVVITIPKYDIAGSSLPYADNMVMPYFDKYLDAKEKFRDIVDTFKEYINAGGGDKLTNVTIKGSADSGTPTLQVPSGYSKLDHPSAKPYNGKTDPKEMNQYLANTRANQYARALINGIKESTGFDLKINVLEGDNFYGQGDGKRGEEFRKITLEPNAEQHSVKNELKIDGKKTPGKKIKNESTKWMVPVYTDGVGKYREGYRVWDNYGNGSWNLALSVERADELDIDWEFGGKKVVLNAKLDNNSLTVDGKLVGRLGDRPPMIDVSNPNPSTDGPIRYYSPKITTKSAIKTAVVDGEKIKVAYLKDIIFTFSNQRRG
jgi:hypothetical protein